MRRDEEREGGREGEEGRGGERERERERGGGGGGGRERRREMYKFKSGQASEATPMVVFLL